MKREQRSKINLKSNSGVTMTDLIIALAIFVTFAGIIGTLFYSAFKVNLEMKLSGASVNYAMQILEDIDKIAYEEVQNGMEDKYRAQFSIPEAFKLFIEVSNYNEGNNKEDFIKKVKLTIIYEFSERTENIVINRLKVKEI